jgi:hypothetical protein
MTHRPKRRAPLSTSGSLARALLVAIGLLGALHARGETVATSRGEAQRRAQTVFQLAARADYVGTAGHARRRDAIAGSTNLRFASPARPIVAGLMIEYRFVDEQADTLLVGGMFTYKKAEWSAAASPYYKKTEHRAAGDWHYWASARRNVTPRHALGVELFGALETGRPAKWTLGYYGAITETLFVSVTAGSAFDADVDWVAGTSVTWRPRPGRR